MKDIFNNSKPIMIEIDEWWFNGRIIQKQKHPNLSSPYNSFTDERFCDDLKEHINYKEAVKYCLNNPCEKPNNFPKDYIGIKE